MTTLAAAKPRTYELGDIKDFPMIATDYIYEGAAVGDNGSGYARPLVAGDPFRGFAIDDYDNSAGAAGAVNVRVKHRGQIQLAIASLAITDVGAPVYASDDDTFVLTKSTNSAIGRVVRFVSSGVGIVEFDAGKGGMGVPTALTDSSTGTSGGNTIGAVSDVATAANAIATIAAKVNELIALQK